MSETPFVRSPSEYRRDFNVQAQYVTDTSLYLQMATGKPIDECRKFVQEKLLDGTFTTRDPEILMTERNKHGDREKKEIKYSDFLRTTAEERGLMSPTMAVYTHPDKKKALLAEWIDENITRRKEVKHEMFVKKMAGDAQGAADAKILQSTFKNKNNSLSGAQASPYTILFNKTAHSTLTSTCRMATSYANANNERFLAGNRHYYSPDIAIQNVVSIISNSDMDAVAACIKKFELHVPTVEEVRVGILFSTNEYWVSEVFNKELDRLLAGMTDVQRTAYHYTSNFKTLRDCNPELVRAFIENLSSVYKPENDLTEEQADKVLASLDGDMVAFISVLCAEVLDGGTFADIKNGKDVEKKRIVAATAAGVHQTILNYGDLIRTFWASNNPPASVAAFPTSLRKAVLVSDTDSTIFTVQDWVIWFRGGLIFDQKSTSIVAAMTYIASMTTIHLLALMSGQMGVIESHIHTLAMKNEFMFPVVIMTGRAKHYTSYISVCEGNVYPELDFELKGVALKDSKLPKHVRDRLEQFIKDIMDTIMRGEMVSLKWATKVVADLEFEIMDNIEAGRTEFLSQARINAIDSYKNPESSNYAYHDLWNEVFGPKYGHAPEPVYQAVKMSVNLQNPTKTLAWIDSFEDQALADRLKAYMLRKKKTHFTQFLIPHEIANANGVPKELISAVDIRNIVRTMCGGYYLILDSLNCVYLDSNTTKLVSDIYERPTKSSGA